MVDESLLPDWGYVNKLTVDLPVATDDYYRFLLRLASHWDPEVTAWILKWMDSELEELARLLNAGCPAFEGSGSPGRNEFKSWLVKPDKDGLLVIQQNTIALLRSVIDDTPEYEILKHKELFGDILRVTHMRKHMSSEARECMQELNVQRRQRIA